ncbi:MAG: sigma-54-dependent Fis family transcriptional regulator, partial [Thiopseudomonas sp.]|nr:sigma-54-dependent Fis family transcriptional regulator [Thiopseudomonas sp.]
NTELLGIDVEIKHSSVEEETSSSNTDPSMEGYFQRFVLEHQDHMTETDLASKLGISRKSLWERRQRLGIPRRKASKNDSN